MKFISTLKWFFAFVGRTDPWGLGRMGIKYAWQSACIMTEEQP